MPLPDIQNILRDLTARRAADRALIDTVAADESILRGSAETMLASSVNMTNAHMVGSVDMAAIRTRLETGIAGLLNVLSTQYTVVCNDMIDILGNAGAGGINKNAIKSRKANSKSLKSMLAPLPMIRMDLMSEFNELTIQFRQAVIEIDVLRRVRGRDAEAVELGNILTDLKNNLVASGAPVAGRMNDKLTDVFATTELQQADSDLTDYVDDHQADPFDTLTYDRLYEYFQTALGKLLMDLESILEVYDGATSVGRTPPEANTLATMRDMEARLCRVFKECTLRVFGGNAEVFTNIDGAGDTFSDVVTALRLKSPPLGLVDGVAPAVTRIPSELRKLQQYIRKHSPSGAFLGSAAFIEVASNRVVTAASEAGSLLATLGRIHTGAYAGDPVIDAFANNLVYGPKLPSIGYSGADFDKEVIAKVKTTRVGS